jgi:hypothetical protein
VNINSEKKILPSPSHQSFNQMHRINYKLQSYDWGKLGISSKVAELASSDGSFTTGEATPYAEVRRLFIACLDHFQTDQIDRYILSSFGWELIPTGLPLLGMVPTHP